MRKLFLQGISQKNYGFSHDIYEYVLSGLGFHCFWLDYQKRYKYVLHLLLKKYDTIWAEASARGLITILCKSIPFLKSRLKHTRIITRFHRVPSMLLEEQGWKAMIPLFGSDTVAWVYDSYNELKKFFPHFPPNKFYVVHNGVDLEIYKPLEHIRKDENLVFTLSSWWEHKRLDLLIRAMEHLPEHKLVVAGNFIQDSYRIQCLNLVKKVRKTIGDKITFVGGQYGLDKVQWFNKAGIFVMPSKLESWSTQTMEAMACETPVLITEGGGMKEFVPVNQRLRTMVSPEELAERINKLSGNEKIGKENRKRVRPYEWSNIRVETDRVMKRWKRVK